jgi:tyrosinase
VGVRKNQNQLTAQDKARYTAAVLQMKQMTAGSVLGTTANVYDKYVIWHNEAVRYMHTHAGHTMAMGPQNHAHVHAGFCPWHRYFVASFEQDLQAADRALGNDGSITVPYWDWVHDHGGSSGRQRSSIWNDDFMGPDGSGSDHAVTSGPFRRGNWQTVLAPATFLRRDFGANIGSLPTSDAVKETLKHRVFDVAPWDDTVDSFRNRLEGWFGDPEGRTGMHNRVHVWVGGDMFLVPTAPNDPVFFLHHCNVDRLWAKWQATWPVARFPDARYPTSRATFDRPRSEGVDPGTGLNDGMYPWDGLDGRSPPVVRPLDVLDHRNMMIGGAQMGYRFDDEPSWSAAP